MLKRELCGETPLTALMHLMDNFCRLFPVKIPCTIQEVQADWKLPILTGGLYEL